MQTLLPSDTAVAAIPLWLVTDAGSAALLQSLPPPQAAWARAQGYSGERHRLLLLPAADGGIAGALWGLGALAGADELSLWDAAALPERLPAGNYRIAGVLASAAATQFTLGWLLGGYRLSRYRGTPSKPATANALIVPPGADLRHAQASAQAMSLARDLINAPASQLGPEELAAASVALAERYGGLSQVHSGEALTRDYPLIAAVGAGSSRAPRLIDCRWQRAGRAARDPGRQGGVLRQRRARPEILGSDAADEKRHGRRRLRTRVGAAVARTGRTDRIAAADRCG